jgi:hypothetical protein
VFPGTVAHMNTLITLDLTNFSLNHSLCYIGTHKNNIGNPKPTILQRSGYLVAEMSAFFASGLVAKVSALASN